ncbi:aquaporin AQPAn.G isoform X2 [Periplaneta americana]|uniref:aquaporin AQPAn.G isoform X2 n=1 Tax=Periplaneta americana TaxID=6978 RepID=UPI0037E90BBA
MAGGGFKERLGVDEISKGIWKVLLAEFIGNLLLNFYGCATCTTVSGMPNSHVLIALGFGLVIMAIVQSIGHVSGAHVNPAVTCAMLVTGRITILKAFFYIVVQCLGALAGTGILKALTPLEKQALLGATLPNKVLTSVQGFGIEYFLGFALILVVFGVCDPNRPESKAVAPLVIGLTVSMGHLAALGYTGASMNPARSLGSAILSGEWRDHWVYWLGPILGGISSGLIYKHAFSAPSVEVTTEYTPVELKRLDKKKDEDGMA